MPLNRMFLMTLPVMVTSLFFWSMLIPEDCTVLSPYSSELLVASCPWPPSMTLPLMVTPSTLGWVLALPVVEPMREEPVSVHILEKVAKSTQCLRRRKWLLATITRLDAWQVNPYPRESKRAASRIVTLVTPISVDRPAWT